MSLLWPELLVLLAVLPVLLGVRIWAMRRRRSGLRYSSLSLIHAAMPRSSRIRRHLPFVLVLVGLASLVVAMARPVAIVPVPAGKTTVVLALDVSRSMCATDIPPNRLIAAEDAASAFVERQGGTMQIGIVAFAGYAEMVQAPTNDQEVLLDVIESLQTGRRTAVGSAILEALDAIAEVDPSVVQFTPDLVPADLVGTRIYNQKTGDFNTSLGPVFTNLLLADEINRAPAKVQSALLEVMQERQVTIGRETFKVPGPVPRPGDPEPDRDRGHLRAARGADRPVHAQGARRLPQHDRGVRHRRADDQPVQPVQQVLTTEQLLGLQQAGRPGLRRPGAVRLRRPAGHGHARPRAHGMKELEPYITFGASPRASINLILTARALAFVRGRNYVLPQDVLDMALDVMRHRLVLSFEALSDNVTTDAL